MRARQDAVRTTPANAHHCDAHGSGRRIPRAARGPPVKSHHRPRCYKNSLWLRGLTFGSSRIAFVSAASRKTSPHETRRSNDARNLTLRAHPRKASPYGLSAPSARSHLEIQPRLFTKVMTHFHRDNLRNARCNNSRKHSLNEPYLCLQDLAVHGKPASRIPSPFEALSHHAPLNRAISPVSTPLRLPYKLTFDLALAPNRLRHPQNLTLVAAFLP